MKRVGLIPSNTGAPGGKKTGYQMSHYIIDGGPFDLSFQRLVASGFELSWADHSTRISAAPDGENTPDSSGDPESAKPKKKDRIKFRCSGCALNAWAKPAAKLARGSCHILLTHVL